MVTPELREKIIGKLDEMTQQQAESVLRYIEVMTTYELPADYDPDKDPMIGFLDGPEDLATRAEEILHGEIDVRSGWTQKKAEK